MKTFPNLPTGKENTVAEDLGKLLEEARELELSGKEGEALLAYRNLLLLHPEAPDAWASYGGLLLSMKQAVGSLNAYSKALAIDPDFLPALAGTGKACLKLGRVEEAVSWLEKALAVDPRQTEVRLDLARCRWRQDQLDLARAVLAPAVEQEPGNPVLTGFLTSIFIREQNWPALHREMLRRVDTDYSGAELEWERFCVNMLFGAMAEGWIQHETRFCHPAIMTPPRQFSQPFWDGEPLQGRTLLLHWEQGLGDTLMFVRYASSVKRLGARVILLAQPELAELVATCPGVDEVVPEGSPIPPFDLQLPLLSLPRIFQTDLASIPAEVPYLSVPQRVPNRVGIQDLLARSNGRVKIGLSWAGSAIHTRDAQRSIAPGALSPLNALREVAWHGFQLGATEIPPLHGMTSLAPLLSNFSDTAFALSGMDLMITVDTAMAHLAGALGIPTLLLVSYIPDWRWMMGRADSPWYPTLRIYRQPKPNDWGTVIRQVVEDLSGEGVGPEPGPGDQVPDNGADLP